METTLKVVLVDAGTGFYRVQRYRLGDFFGPVERTNGCGSFSRAGERSDAWI